MAYTMALPKLCCVKYQTFGSSKSKQNKINNPFVHKCLQQEVTFYFHFAKSEKAFLPRSGQLDSMVVLFLTRS